MAHFQRERPRVRGTLTMRIYNAGARLPREQADALATVAEREEEEPRAPVLARRGMADHGAVAVVDLALLARRGLNHGVGLRGRGAAELADVAHDARVGGGEAVGVDEVLPDRHRVAPAGERRRDQLPVRLARAGGGTAPGARQGRRGGRVGRHPDPVGRICRRPRAGVGRHLNGRFWRLAPPARRTDHDARRPEVGARRLAANTRCLFNAPERPPQPAQRDHLLSFLGTQDVAHPGGRRAAHRPSQRLGARRRVGRFSGVDQWPVLGVDRGYVLMTLGPAIAALPALERLRGPAARVLAIYGRVPLFYYVLHIYVIHALAIGAAYLAHRDVGALFTVAFAFPKDYGFGLPVVYAVWLVIVSSLYLPCRWFAGVKQRRHDPWLSFL